MNLFEQWEEERLKQLEPKSNIWASYDFSDAVSGLAKLEVNTSIMRGAEENNRDNDLILSCGAKRRKVSFDRTNKRVVKEINKMLAMYSDDYWEPELEAGLPVCTTDYPKMDVREKMPTTPDEQGYLPAHEDVLEVTQLEAGYLDKLTG